MENEEVVIEQPQPEEEITAEVPVVEPEVVPEPEPKKTFKKIIQPMAADGKTPLGQPHVYESDTQEGLDAQMAEAIANGTRKIHELSRKVVLESTKEPEGAEFQAEAPVWKPRELTEEEKFLVTTDPTKSFGIQFKAEFGMTPAEYRQEQEKTAENARLTRERGETAEFVEDHPEYLICEENKKAILAFFEKHPRMTWRKKNLEIAYKELSESGLLKTKTVEAVPVVVEPAPEPRTEAPAVKQPDFPAVIRSGSSRATAPIKTKDGKPTAEEIANMTAEEYAKHHPELQQAR